MLLKEIKTIFHKELDSLYPKEEVDGFFYLLTGHYLGVERFMLALRPKLVLTKEEEQPLFEALSELKLNRPVQYIIGQSHFMGLDFHVNENVLIPRPETEELVRWVVEEISPPDFQVQDREKTRSSISDGSRGDHRSGTVILDIGTGSGCIAISLAKQLPEAEVHALDVSEAALEVATQNALRHQADIKLTQADILTLDSLGEKFDIIVSNPPYVRELEKKHMHQNVLEHEPDLALFVSDDNPLVFYKRIVHFALENLKPEGRLYLEINQYLAKETRQLLEDHNFTDIEVRTDLFGNERMVKGHLVAT
ncbi:peptide chain release factor N(5)-glutamine methyltransferase [Flavobacteriaceae bacterium TP-CH-4]|uniref:Release factor glutamine methyltransferase n=1 Tax=Pelagihabitans pacificus TaxID=2696054 RepID=A0A967ASU0_9FLAO|nr:peptide chain release factor N(5)-glutamine methyltransferase [Pelagihabitans pacificus]NHF59317.1 peptide chain release factor N(5)-glutamine methyltransferase [Pelagihabitans pacificus]